MHFINVFQGIYDDEPVLEPYHFAHLSNAVKKCFAISLLLIKF